MEQGQGLSSPCHSAGPFPFSRSSDGGFRVGSSSPKQCRSGHELGGRHTSWLEYTGVSGLAGTLPQQLSSFRVMIISFSPIPTATFNVTVVDSLTSKMRDHKQMSLSQGRLYEFWNRSGVVGAPMYLAQVRGQSHPGRHLHGAKDTLPFGKAERIPW